MLLHRALLVVNLDNAKSVADLSTTAAVLTSNDYLKISLFLELRHLKFFAAVAWSVEKTDPSTQTKAVTLPQQICSCLLYESPVTVTPAQLGIHSDSILQAYIPYPDRLQWFQNER
jgi:hypothetical protein